MCIISANVLSILLSSNNLRTKKARTKLCVSVFEVFDYLSIKYTSKAHADRGVSVIALLLMEFESVEVSKTRIKAKRFSNMSKVCVSVIRYCFIGINLIINISYPNLKSRRFTAKVNINRQQTSIFSFFLSRKDTWAFTKLTTYK
jgi:hypothetical protein